MRKNVRKESEARDHVQNVLSLFVMLGSVYLQDEDERFFRHSKLCALLLSLPLFPDRRGVCCRFGA